MIILNLCGEKSVVNTVLFSWSDARTSPLLSFSRNEISDRKLLTRRGEMVPTSFCEDAIREVDGRQLIVHATRRQGRKEDRWAGGRKRAKSDERRPRIR